MTAPLARLVPAPEARDRVPKEIALGVGRLTFGRGGRNDVDLNDPEVSKAHAEVVGNADGFVIKDLGSSNGTYVNGALITNHRLVEGDVVDIGGCRFTFQFGEAAAKVTIVGKSPIDRTQILATWHLEALAPGNQIRDLEQLRRKYDRVRTAFEAVGKLIETTDIAQLCKQILEVAFKLVKAETGAVLLFDPSGELTPWASQSKQGGTGQVVLSRTIVDQVVRDHAAILASDALTDSRWSSSESLVLSGVRSLMCVPLISGDDMYGLMQVGNSSEVNAFARDDLELLSGIGTGAGVALSNAFLAHRLAEEARTRESLGRFLSPVLVEQVMQRGIDLKRGGEEREVTVMFADIRGFTSLTERSRPADVVSLLNEYFEHMVEVVFRHAGALDKYIGDALMAVWGTPVSNPQDATKAVTAAIEMVRSLTTLNAVRRTRKNEPIEIGIGLASGRCVSGAIGAKRRMEYTVIGDAVNLASRLAGLAKAGQVLCDEVTFERAGRPARSQKLPSTQVKGKSQAVSVFQLEVKG